MNLHIPVPMNLHIPVPKQAHVTHVIDGFVLGHRSWKRVSIRLGADLGQVAQNFHHLVRVSCDSIQTSSKRVPSKFGADQRMTSQP